MQHFFQSPFLQALGFAIANSLWQTAMLWLIFMCVNSLPLTAAVKYRLAVGAQVTSFIWFLITFQFYYAQYSHNARQLNTIQVIDPLPANGGLTTQLANWMVRGEQLLPYVSTAYLLLMVFLCSRWFLGYRQTQSIRFNGLHKIPVDWRLFVKKIAAQLGIRKEIAIFLSDTVSTPVTIGFLKPVILIPVASINHLTIHQLEAVILHELAHIKRYDYLVNMILSVAEIGLFFNPFTQLLSRNIRKERENSCDDWVLQFRYNATTYAEALLRIAYLQSAPAFAMAATGKKNDLLARVKRMIEKKENRFNYRKQLLAFLVVTGMLSSIAWLNPIAKPHNEITARSKQVAMQPRRAQVTADHPKMNLDNPLFNPAFFLSDPLKTEIKKSLASAEKELHFTEGQPEAPFAPMIA
ncbi:MAG: regulatory sensor-transducer, BlaR1/MecR1 family, partial [Sediminibacterium sp.]|nr:regulatory sensor-transducer, BlaR1/MecR1 family [Sediminibacterium sp.]